MAPRTSSLQPAPIMTGESYFDYQPSEHNCSPIKARKPIVHCLDAFHQRPSTPLDYPLHANLYAKRALPPLPPSISTVPALSKRPSMDSLVYPTSARTSVTEGHFPDCHKSLPPLPSLERCPSLESVATESASSRPSRPRAGRSISFRGILHRHTYPSNASTVSVEDVPSLASSVSSRDSRTDSIMGDLGLAQVKTNTTIIPSATSSRRPSAVSLSQLRAASKKVNASAPIVASRPTTARKGSFSAGSVHKWFGRHSEEDKEDVPPMPATPLWVQELSFTQCYYFFARNCNGYVLSNGVNGDACENCANAGFLGSP